MSDTPHGLSDIEVRFATLDDGTQEFDEVVASCDAMSVHLEKMDSNQFALIVETRRYRACFMIGAKRAPVDAWESWHDPINRRAEAQKRRWNALTPAQRKRKKRS